MHDTGMKSPLLVGIEEKLPLAQRLLYGAQHLLGLTGIWIFPGIIGAVVGLSTGEVSYMVQMCFITTGIVTLLQSGKMLKLPVVQGPTAAFFAAIMATGAASGLGTAYGSMLVAALIFMALSIPIGKWGLIGHLAKLMADPIVYGGLLVIIGAQLAYISVPQWFGMAGSFGYPGFNMIAAVITIITIVGLMVFGGNTILRRGAVLWGIIIGTAFYGIFGQWDMTPIAQASIFSMPKIFPWGFQIQAGVVILMLLAFLQATAEAMGIYALLASWDNQTVSVDRANRGIFGEVFGCALGAIFGGIGTTSYPENVGIIRISGIGSRHVTFMAGALAVILGFIPKIGTLIAIIPSAVLGGAATILFGIIAYSGVQMMSRVEWDELNMAVASTSFMVSLGCQWLPDEILAMLPSWLSSIVSVPMMVGVILLLILNTSVNMVIRPWMAKKENSEINSKAA